MKEAMFYEKLEGGRVRCGLCRFRCLIDAGGRGHCAVRENRGGVLYSLVYGRVVAEQVDPIEKKPLFHVLPSSRSYSVATVGCNFRCLHCQNYRISQPEADSVENSGSFLAPAALVERALAAGCRSISYTYTEPTIFFEYAYDTALLARAAGLKNVLVSNGYITEEALEAIAPYLDAANIEDELRGIDQFIASELGPQTPWHVSQFYPTYRLKDAPRTPITTLRKARSIGLAAGLRYVYEGNVPGEGGENSCCPACGGLLVKRYGYIIEKNLLANGKCPGCGRAVEGVWE